MSFLAEIYGIQTIELLWIILAGILIGLSRTAVSGFGMLSVPILAGVFGGKESTGIILPMLIIADIFAIVYFRKKADKKTFVHLLPWAFVGIGVGLVIGNHINDSQFKIIIGLIVIVCVLILVVFEVKGDKVKIPDHFAVYAIIGITVGFASMVGNSAGPIIWIYLVTRSLNKFEFMGTSALFFFILNITKLPLQIFVWHNIKIERLVPFLFMIPIIILAAWAGTFMIKHINEKAFKHVVIVIIGASAVNLLI